MNCEPERIDGEQKHKQGTNICCPPGKPGTAAQLLVQKIIKGCEYRKAT
jgi:hypothetical protein